MARTIEEIIEKFNSVPNLDEVFDIMSDMSKLKEEKGKLEQEVEKFNEELNNLDVQYTQQILDISALIKHIHDLDRVVEKHQGSVGKTTLRMQKGYFLLQAISQEVTLKKKGDPTEIERVSIWSSDQNKVIRDKLYSYITALDDGEQQGS